MHLLFIDESGTPPKPDKCHGQYLVIGGLIIPDATWYGVSRDLGKLRERYKVSKEIKWKHFGQSKDDGKNAVIHLDHIQKELFRTELFKLITARRALKIIACVTSCEAAYQLNSINIPDDIYELTYKGVTERFQYFLYQRRHWLTCAQVRVVMEAMRSGLAVRLFQAWQQASTMAL